MLQLNKKIHDLRLIYRQRTRLACIGSLLTGFIAVVIGGFAFTGETGRAIRTSSLPGYSCDSLSNSAGNWNVTCPVYYGKKMITEDSKQIQYFGRIHIQGVPSSW